MDFISKQKRVKSFQDEKETVLLWIRRLIEKTKTILSLHKISKMRLIGGRGRKLRTMKSGRELVKIGLRCLRGKGKGMKIGRGKKGEGRVLRQILMEPLNS